MAVNIRLPVVLFFLLALVSILYLSIHYFVQNPLQAPPSSFEQAEMEGSIVQFDLNSLEIYIQGILERARSGKSIGHKDENLLREIKARLALLTGTASELAAKLIAMIDEILELNRELIHLEDGEHNTDDN